MLLLREQSVKALNKALVRNRITFGQLNGIF